jgi:hypothetical protein
MADDNVTTKKPRLTEAEQDRLIQGFITEASELIATIKKEPLILPHLARLGFNEAELTTGEDLALTAQNSFSGRHEAIGNLNLKNAALEAADKVVAKRNTDYREVVRLAFKDTNARQMLGATGVLPRDRQQLITHMRTSFTAAAKPPYATELTRRGYDAAELAAANGEVDALAATLTDRDAAVQAAKDSTVTRNTDYKALREWVSGLNRAIKRARARMG